MKKQYTAPEVEVVGTHASKIICASPTTEFGNGETDNMHSKELDFFFGDME